MFARWSSVRPAGLADLRALTSARCYVTRSHNQQRRLELLDRRLPRELCRVKSAPHSRLGLDLTRLLGHDLFAERSNAHSALRRVGLLAALLDLLVCRVDSQYVDAIQAYYRIEADGLCSRQCISLPPVSFSIA